LQGAFLCRRHRRPGRSWVPDLPVFFLQYFTGRGVLNLSGIQSSLKGHCFFCAAAVQGLGPTEAHQASLVPPPAPPSKGVLVTTGAADKSFSGSPPPPQRSAADMSWDGDPFAWGTDEAEVTCQARSTGARIWAAPPWPRRNRLTHDLNALARVGRIPGSQTQFPRQSGESLAGAGDNSGGAMAGRSRIDRSCR
jgi:hypothetical protein